MSDPEALKTLIATLLTMIVMTEVCQWLRGDTDAGWCGGRDA